MDIADVTKDAKDGNVAWLHRETARFHGDVRAIEYRGQTLTHDELRTESARVAGGLAALGVSPGDTMLLYLPNCPAYLIATLGGFKAGVVVSPVNPQYRERELTHQLSDTEATVVLTHAALLEHLDAALETLEMNPIVIAVGSSADHIRPFQGVRSDELFVERAADDVALLPYTSGTTDTPKGVQLTHRNVRAQMNAVLARSHELDDEEINSLVWLPLYHITGFTHAALQPLLRGGSVCVRSTANWNATACMELIQEKEITHFIGVTTMYVDMVTADAFGAYDLTSLETAMEGGAKMSLSTQREFEATAGVAIGEGYGLTETHGATHTQSNATFGLRHGTVGQPSRMTDCTIVDDEDKEVPPGDVGELLVRGPQVMKGYHEMPEATETAFTENGYFRTGDIARRDEDNYYEIVDRKKHVIVSAGYNVYPSELEAVLAEHDVVVESAVIGVPDERRTEVPKAFVVPRSDVEVGTDVATELQEFVLDTVAPYKHPREIEFVEELPRTSSGKIQKFKLQQADR